jgi:hypothetical protein
MTRMKWIFNKYFLYVLTALFMLCLSPALPAQDKVLEDHKASVIRMVPDSVAERMKKEKDFLYANDPSYWEDDQAAHNNSFTLIDAIGRSPLLKWLLYIMLIGVIVFAIYQVMVVNDFFIFTRSRSKKKTKEEPDDELMSDNIEGKINRAVENKEYRLAIRYMYIKTLQLLHEKNKIKLHARSTNQDYVRQMQKHSGISQFRLLTRIYEYVWYGEFHPSDQQFDVIQTNFNQFISHD